MTIIKQIPNTKMINPKILYYGFPVILLSTLNEDGTVNISPLSSSWALGDCIVLGIGLGGKAIENLERHPECVINIPDPSLWENVEQLAPYTGKKQFQILRNKLVLHIEKRNLIFVDSHLLILQRSFLLGLWSVPFKSRQR